MTKKKKVRQNIVKQKKVKEDEEISLNVIKERIEKELKEDRQVLGLSLYKELVFMNETLSKLKKEISSNGIMENFKNGKQDFIRESQALKSYNITIKNYKQCITDLLNILPPPKDKSIFDDFDDF